MIQLASVISFPVEELLLTRLAFSPDGSEIAAGAKSFRTYAVESGQPRREFTFPDFLAQLVYSPDGRFIAAANVGDNHPRTRGRVAVFEADSGRQLFTSEAALPVETCAWADGNGSGGQRLYWNDAQPPAEAGGAVTSAVASVAPASGAVAASLPVPDLRISALAPSGEGVACFGREAQGTARTVDGAQLVFRSFRLLTLAGDGTVRHSIDLGIGAGVHALSPDGKLLAAEMVDFKNNERHVSLIDVDTGVEANLLSLEANTLPVLAFGMGSEYLLCMKEDGEANFNVLRIWRTSDLRLLGEAQLPLSLHTLAVCLEHSLIAGLGGGEVAIYGLS